ncbi:ATP-binding protein [Maritimibacter sp. 55A14]|uniref:hybrid sensor histidine kinase/response regulator n=1 Tax=Maritimibacter sp. 55A14 TaxID=2174844 RepID=UPI001E450AFB|nr:ATP-binding protein [Maritimibacter sp. 55A14]
MAYSANLPGPVTATARILSSRVGWFLILSAACLGLGSLLPGTLAQLALLSAAGMLTALAGLVAILGRRGRGPAGPGTLGLVTGILHGDSVPAFCTDRDGIIRYRNAAAARRFKPAPGDMLARALAGQVSNTGFTLRRMRETAATYGHAREDIVGRGGHMRLSAHDLGADGTLWRLEDMSAPRSNAPGFVGLPMLTASQSGTILSMNEPLRELLGGRVKHLERIFTDLPLRPDRVHRIAGARGPVDVRVTVQTGAGGRREIYLAPCEGEELSGAATERFFDELPVALLKLAPDGTVAMANRMVRGLLCHSMNGPVHLGELVEGLGRPVREWLADAVRGRAPRKPEVVRAARAEGDVFLQIMLHRIVEDGEVSLVAVLNDATELKTLEAQFVQSQKMQAIGQLAGGVAHDFNNLLTAISGHCDLLLLRHDESDSEYADLIQINQNANRAASLVGQLLAFSRKQNLQPETLDMRDTMADLAHLLNRLVGERIALTLSHDPDLRPIRADKRQLEQVIMNLVVNARDAMQDGGGEIRIETENCHLAEDLRRDRAIVPAGEYVAVRVTDDGTGIAPDKLTKVFEPFYTTKRTGEGTGLGLSTAYGIVKQTGGFIFADSAPGTGTVFTLYFPAHDRPAAAPAPVSGGTTGAGPQVDDGVVLLVEDEAPVRAFAARALRMRGYTVIEAESAEDALDRLSDPDLSVDVFVTDVVMPGMDGPTWVREALKSRPDARVVFVSGYAEDSVAEHQSTIPNAVFLPKPFSLSELTATVQGQMRPPQA